MKTYTYLLFDGNCAEAIAFYAKLFNGKIETSVTYSEAPEKMDLPPEWDSRLMHAQLSFNDGLFMASDAWPGSYKKPEGLAVTLEVTDNAEAERLFNALAEGGEVTMKLQETFWAKCFGTVTDRFGIPWMIDCEKPEWQEKA